MSSELEEHNLDHTSQTQSQCISKAQCGMPVPGKCCGCQGNKSNIVFKLMSNSQQLHSSNNYLKRQTNKNPKPVNRDQHMPKLHRNKVLIRWKESRHKEDLEQKEEPKTWKDVEQKEGTMKGAALTQADKKGHYDVLEPGEELGCGEELAQGGALDWEVGIGQGKEFVSEKGEDSLELLFDSCSDREEEMRGVIGRLNREKEGWEVVRNSKTGSLKVPVGVHFVVQSATQKHDKQIVNKDGLNINQTSANLYDKAYTGGLFNDEMFSNHIYSSEINTNELCLDRTDTVRMFPDVCDAGEALADVDGLFECDLFEQSEPSQTLEIEEVSDHGDTVMLSVEEGSESSNQSLSSLMEECGTEDKQDDKEQKVENTSPLLKKSSQDIHPGISQDSLCTGGTFGLKAEREAGILAESSHKPDSSSSSVCSSESMMTYEETIYLSPSQWSNGNKPETEQASLSKSVSSDINMTFELEHPFVSSAVCLPLHQKSQQTKVEQCDGQKEERADIEDQSVMATARLEAYPEEHVYEETEPKFQTNAFLQSRKYLMTRSISVETPSNRLNQMSPTLSGKERLMLHPQSYYTHNFLCDSLPTLTGSLGCLSPGSSCPSSDLNINTMHIPPPFELSSITKRPIRKSTPALPSDMSASCRKLDLGFKRYFLPLRFLRKSERRSLADSRSVSSRSSSESSPQESCKKFSLMRQNPGTPEPQGAHNCSLPSSPSSFLLRKNTQSPGLTTHHNNTVVTPPPSSWGALGLEPDDFVHAHFMKPIPFLKPRSFSSPNVDSSVYENVLNTSPHYENVQLRLLNPSNQNQRSQNSTNDTDGYVDMSSLPGFQNKGQSSEQETESAYTICSPNVRTDGSVSVSVGMSCKKKEDKKSSERPTVNCSRAFYSAKELLDSESQHVKTLKLLSENIHANEMLAELWSELPVIYSFHQDLLSQLEIRIKEWDQNEGIADIILAKKVDFSVFSSFISNHDNKMKSLDEMDKTLDGSCLKQQLLQVVVRVLQYRMLLTDYQNNISPDSREYEDAQAALAMVSDVADQANNNLKNGADLLCLVRIEHRVLGLKNLLQPGRLFVKEGTLMKASRKSKQPRHLFLLSDILLYTYPQQDGKYRLINTLALTGMEVTKLIVENNAQNALKIEVKDICITLSASSSIERDDWFVTLNRTIADLGSLLEAPSGGFKKAGECLGDNAPPMVSVSQVAVCMNCPIHFSLTHRRHHCHACGKVVCRDCCRNKVPLKYMKNKRAKVCDKCYSELSKHEGDVAVVTENYSRPLSAVFQNIHPTSLWRGRKGQISFNQVAGPEGEMSGTLQRSRNRKRSWKSLWFLLKDKVLYAYPQPEERVACESLPLLGFSVRSESEGDSSVFQLYHKTTLYYTFKAQDMHTAQRWVNAMEEATVL